MPLGYAEISERILREGYYKTEGATPHATVNAQITASIKHEGSESPFIKAGRGTFALKETASTSLPSPPSSVVVVAVKPTVSLTEAEVETSESIIQSFGMYWQRDLVIWRGETRMFGKQQAQAKPVDFGKQKGIYILYDHHTVVYVGRSIDRPLGKRLYEHTVDRLGSRWNRFSWFGLLDVTSEGSLREVPFFTSLPAMIATFEALLIEALEPPQNRKRGDDFSAIEYIQDIDPELKEREIKDMVRTFEQSLRGGS